jgi:SPP1 gp7 family putative phage head morphogenesis protein
MRPPAGPELAYRKALRSLASQAAATIEREIFPLLEGTIEQRQDAAGDVRDTVRARLANIKRALLGVDRSALPHEIASRVATANASEFQRVLKVDVASMGSSVADKVALFRNDNVKLIESIPAQLLDEVDKTIENAWAKGQRVEVLRTEVQKRFDVSKSRADLIARDQVLKLNAQITKSRQTSAGIVEYVWTTSHDERVRGNPDGKYPDSDSDHYSLDGTRQRWDVPPVTNRKTGATNHPGEDYQCRCVAVPVVSFLEDPDLDE